MIDDFIGDATQRMDKSVDATHEHFNSVRTGRATPALLDRITIDYYGTPTPLKNLATINAPEPRMLTIQPFDPTLDQADREDDPGVRPRPDAVERRQADPPADPAADRGAPQGARQGRARRWPRRAASRCATCAATRSSISRSSSKNGDVGDDDERAAEGRVQKLTDEHVAKIDDLLKRKEAEIMEV